MAKAGKPSVLFFAPFVSSTMRVEPGWIDYNGHLNMAYYHVLFDRAVDEAFALAGLGADYLSQRGASFFAAECHVRYLREIYAAQLVRVTVQLVDLDEKRIHFFMEMRHATEGWLAATSENLSLHVDMVSRKVVPFAQDIRDNLAVMQAAHGRMKRPDGLGRVMGMGNTETASGLSAPDRPDERYLN